LTNLGNTGNGLFAVDRAQRIRAWNKAAEELLGHTAAEVLGRPCDEVIGARDRTGQCCCGPDCRVLAAGRAGCPLADFDARVRSKSGMDVWLTFTVLTLAIPGDPLTVHLFHPVRHRDQVDVQDPEATGRLAATPVKLTPRERAILNCLVEGRTTAEIAEALAISPLTVRTHIRNMLTKTRVNSRVQLVARAVRSGLR